MLIISKSYYLSINVIKMNMIDIFININDMILNCWICCLEMIFNCLFDRCVFFILIFSIFFNIWINMIFIVNIIIGKIL